ncbi:MAG: DMT family transporter [Chitinophagaceae bacterium]
MTETKQHNSRIAGAVATFLGAVLFSTKAIIVKKAFQDIKIDALSLLALRMICAFPFYIVIALYNSRKKDVQPLTKRQWISVIVLGLFGYYASSLLDFVGLQYVSAGLERLILFLYPTFTVFINAYFFKLKVSRIQLLALVLTYTGIAVAYIGQLHIETANSSFYWGSFLILCCAFTYAIFIAGSGKMVPQVGTGRFTSYSILAAAGGVFLHFTLAGNYQALHADSRFWGYALLLATLATVIPTLLISYGLKSIGSNNVAIVSGIGPVSTILQAHWVLGESIFPAQIAGTLLVITGVLLIGWKSRVVAE